MEIRIFEAELFVDHVVCLPHFIGKVTVRSGTMKSSISQENKGWGRGTSLSQNRCVVPRSRDTIDCITEGSYGISNPRGLQEEPRKASVLEGHCFPGLNDCFSPLAVM